MGEGKPLIFNGIGMCGLLTLKIQPELCDFTEINSLILCNPPSLSFWAIIDHTLVEQGLTDHIRLYGVV